MVRRAKILTLIGLLVLVTEIVPPAVPATTPCPQSVGYINALLGLIVPASACPGPTNGPLAAFTYDSCFCLGVPGFPMNFNGSWSASTTGRIVLYTWNFGDGTPLVQTSNPSTTHNYQSLGPNNAGWQATLTVQDSSGATDTITQEVTPDAIPRFTFQPSNPSLGQPVTFDGSTSQVYGNSNTTAAYTWSFGDGTSAPGTVVTHAYSEPTLFRVILTFSNVYGISQVSKTVNDPAGGGGGRAKSTTR